MTLFPGITRKCFSRPPAPLHDNIHMAVLFVTLLVVAIHRHHPELHQKPQFDAWLQHNNITNEVRKVMQKVAGKCRQMGIVPVSFVSIFSCSCSCLCCCGFSGVHSCVTAAASLLLQQLLVLFLLFCDHYCLSSPAAALLLMKIMLMHFVLQQAPRVNGEDDQKEPEVDESVADDDDPEQELNVSTVGCMYIYSVAHSFSCLSGR